MAEEFQEQQGTANEDALAMRFDPNTIQHLVANSYDADANVVKIHINDIAEKEITVKNDGKGRIKDGN